MQDKVLVVKQKDAEFTKIILEGDMFKYATGDGIYLSGNNFNSKKVDLYSNVKSLSTHYVAFSGIPVEEFNVVNSNYLEFYLPKNLPIGFYDIIFCNPAGYYKASNSKKFAYINVVETAFDSVTLITRIGTNVPIFTLDNKYIAYK